METPSRNQRNGAAWVRRKMKTGSVVFSHHASLRRFLLGIEEALQMADTRRMAQLA